jgi:hypothetical protein
MNLIERILRYRPNISFKRMLRRARNRVEIIVTFLAVLELLRRRKVEVVQELMFGDILITPLAPELQPEGASMDDEEESVFEIPKVQPEGDPAEEFEFEVNDRDQFIGDQGTVDQESTYQPIAETSETVAQHTEMTDDGSTVSADQQIPEPGAGTPA